MICHELDDVDDADDAAVAHSIMTSLVCDHVTLYDHRCIVG